MCEHNTMEWAVMDTMRLKAGWTWAAVDAVAKSCQDAAFRIVLNCKAITQLQA
jgi:hypothetical protein